MDKANVLQIVPATDWWAIYGAEGAEEFSSPLICWAVVEGTDGERLVVGMDTDSKGTVEICAYANNFRRYEFRGRLAEATEMPPD